MLGAHPGVSLHEDVDDISVSVNGSPYPVARAPDIYEDFVHVPDITESAFPWPESPWLIGAEPAAPRAGGLVGHDDTASRQENLEVPDAQRESMVERDEVADDLDRELPASRSPDWARSLSARSRAASTVVAGAACSEWLVMGHFTGIGQERE